MSGERRERLGPPKPETKVLNQVQYSLLSLDARRGFEENWESCGVGDSNRGQQSASLEWPKQFGVDQTKFVVCAGLITQRLHCYVVALRIHLSFRQGGAS